MHRKQDRITTFSNVQSLNPDQLHVYEPTSNEEAFILPKLTFVHNSDKSLDIVVYNKNFSKGTALGKIFLEIEKGAQELRVNNTRKIIENKIPSKVAMATNEIIFNYIDIQIFKKLVMMFLGTLPYYYMKNLKF